MEVYKSQSIGNDMAGANVQVKGLECCLNIILIMFRTNYMPFTSCLVVHIPLILIMHDDDAMSFSFLNDST